MKIGIRLTLKIELSQKNSINKKQEKNMKVAICDYKEPLNRDLEIEKSVFKKFLGEDTEISLYVHE